MMTGLMAGDTRATTTAFSAARPGTFRSHLNTCGRSRGAGRPEGTQETVKPTEINANGLDSGPQK